MELPNLLEYKVKQYEIIGKILNERTLAEYDSINSAVNDLQMLIKIEHLSIHHLKMMLDENEYDTTQLVLIKGKINAENKYYAWFDDREIYNHYFYDCSCNYDCSYNGGGVINET